MAVLKGFVGGSYLVRSIQIEGQRTVNFYPEVDESRDGPNMKVASLMPTPGTRLLLPAGDGPARGLYYATNNVVYYCRGDKVYTLQAVYTAGLLSGFTSTLIATIGTTIGPVYMVDNGFTLCLVDGSPTGGWISTLGSITMTQITDLDFYGSTSISFLNGYFIFNKPNTGVVYISSLYGTDFDALDFISAEASPDNLMGCIVTNNYLWAFGTRTIQAFYPNSSVAVDAFPFVADPGSVIQTGTIAPASLAYQDNKLFWLGANEKGAGIVYTNQGFAPLRISTHAIEYAIQSYPNIQDATGYAYQQEGHLFYVLNFTEANTTWVYDATSELWHQRAYLDQNSGDIDRQLPQVYTYGFNEHLVGDYRNGAIYKYELDLYYDEFDTDTETGSYIYRERTSPHTQTDNLFGIVFTRFVLDLEVGIGTDGINQGNNPQVALQWSDDGGYSWSNESWQPAGVIGQTRTRVQWFNLGYTNNRVWRIKMSDPVKWVILGAYYDAKSTGG